MMESIEKLRKYALCDKGERFTAYINADELADEIEAEIESRYMLLPVDADGMPVRVGDELECHANGYDGAFTVFAIGNDVVVGNHDIEWLGHNPSKWFHVSSFCTHAKPRTIEDVLRDLVDVAAKVDIDSCAEILECVESIRKAVKR